MEDEIRAKGGNGTVLHKPQLLEIMLTVFALHFLHQSESNFIQIVASWTRKKLQTIWPVLAIQTFTPPKRLVPYFLHAKIKRRVVIVPKS
jgi:hypothetical protein